MLRNTHLITSRTSTEQPVETEGTKMDNASGPALDETVNSTNGAPDDSPNEGRVHEIEIPGLFDWMQQAVNTTLQGMADRLSLEHKQRASAVHTAKLILGDESTTGDYLAVAGFILGELTD